MGVHVQHPVACKATHSGVGPTNKHLTSVPRLARIPSFGGHHCAHYRPNVTNKSPHLGFTIRAGVGQVSQTSDASPAADTNATWQSFAAAVTGEWDAITVTFDRDGGAQELPEYYVPAVGFNNRFGRIVFFSFRFL